MWRSELVFYSAGRRCLYITRCLSSGRDIKSMSSLSHGGIVNPHLTGSTNLRRWIIADIVYPGLRQRRVHDCILIGSTICRSACGEPCMDAVKYHALGFSGEGLAPSIISLRDAPLTGQFSSHGFSVLRVITPFVRAQWLACMHAAHSYCPISTAAGVVIRFMSQESGSHSRVFLFRKRGFSVISISINQSAAHCIPRIVSSRVGQRCCHPMRRKELLHLRLPR